MYTGALPPSSDCSIKLDLDVHVNVSIITDQDSFQEINSLDSNLDFEIKKK